MSRLFDDAAQEYLACTGGCGITDYPVTLAAWFNMDVQDNQGLVELSGGAAYCSLWLRDPADSDVLAYSAVGGAYAKTTTSYAVNTWEHACGVFASATDRRAFLNGGGKGTNANNVAWPAPTSTRVGFGINANYASGSIAEPVIYSCALTDLEVWLLSRGVPPPLIRPQSLVAYWPLWDTDRDVWNARYHMTPFNTPSWANHPPKVLDWWRKYGNRAQTQFALKQFISRQPYNLSYHKPQAFVPTGITRIPRHPAQYNTLAIY